MRRLHHARARPCPEAARLLASRLGMDGGDMRDSAPLQIEEPSMKVYHFTDTARLPFILKSGILKPGRNTLAGFPDPDFLWATTRSVGDYTASGAEGYRRGLTRLVRFTLKRDDFVPWRQIVTTIPAWTPTHVERLERAARGLSNPADWWCRHDALPLGQCVEIHTRSYTSGWVPLRERQVLELGGASPALALPIAGKLYVSRERKSPNGAVGYAVEMLSNREAA
jgi:hypothetical protein